MRRCRRLRRCRAWRWAAAANWRCTAPAGSRNLESYIGLVEVGVGLVPGGGGLAWGARRAAEEHARAPETYILHFLSRYMMSAGTATVSKSALEGRALGYLLASDPIVFNAYELLYTAVREAKAMFDQGYRPPIATTFPAAGRSVRATIERATG
jgi:3-hydroxyacyl-CoA dehydrogenase